MTSKTVVAPREEDRPVKVEFDNDMMLVTLKNGRMIATPLEWYPTLERVMHFNPHPPAPSPSGRRGAKRCCIQSPSP